MDIMDGYGKTRTINKTLAGHKVAMHRMHSHSIEPVASLGGERTAPGDTLQEVTSEGKKICGQIHKE